MATQSDEERLLLIAEGVRRAAQTYGLGRLQRLLNDALQPYAQQLGAVDQFGSVAEIESEIRVDLLPQLKDEYGIEKFLGKTRDD